MGSGVSREGAEGDEKKRDYEQIEDIEEARCAIEALETEAAHHFAHLVKVRQFVREQTAARKYAGEKAVVLVSTGPTAPTFWHEAVRAVKPDVFCLLYKESSAEKVGEEVAEGLKAAGVPEGSFDTCAWLCHGGALTEQQQEPVLAFIGALRPFLAGAAAPPPPPMAEQEQASAAAADADTDADADAAAAPTETAKTAPLPRIDLLACDVAKGDAAAKAFAELEKRAGLNLAASTDITGNASEGGNWILETDGVDVAGTYFEAGALPFFTDTLVERGDGYEFGAVKFFNTSKGYGFIQPESSSRDVFFHGSTMVEEVYEGDRVLYFAELARKGFVATKVLRAP